MSKLLSFLNNAFVIGAITIFGYLLAYTYELGYLSFYKTPSTFISLDLQTFFNFIAYSLVTWLIIFYAFESLSSLGFFQRDTYIKRSIMLFTLISLPLIVEIIIYGTNFKEYGGFVVFVLISAMIWFIFPLFTQRDKTTYEEKIKADFEKDTLPKNSLLGKLIAKNRILFYIIMLLFWILLISYNIGRGQALSQADYQVIKLRNVDYAIVRIYGDKILAMPLNKSKRELKHVLYFFNINDLGSQNIPISFLYTGALTLKE